MARWVELKGRRFWILSEPQESPGWKATVIEENGETQEAVGIDATADTRVAADDAAERELRRRLQA